MGKRISSDSIEWTLELNLQEFIKSVEKSGKSVDVLCDILHHTGESFDLLQSKVQSPIDSFTSLFEAFSQLDEFNFGLDDADLSRFRDLIADNNVIINQFSSINSVIESQSSLTDKILAQESRFVEGRKILDDFKNSISSLDKNFGSLFLNLRDWQKKLRENIKNRDIFGIENALTQIKTIYNYIDLTQLRQIFTKSGKFDTEQAYHVEKIRHNLEAAKLSSQKGKMSEVEFEIAKIEELIRYQNDVYNRLLELRETPGLVINQVESIDEEISKSLKLIADYQDQLSNAFANFEHKELDNQLNALNAFYDNLEITLNDHLTEDIKLQDHYSILLKQNQLNRNRDLLKSHEDYHRRIEESENISSSQKLELLTEEDKVIRKLKKDQLKYLVSIEKTIESMTSDPIGLEGLKKNLDDEVIAVSAAYDAMIKIARENGLEIEELERQRLAKLRDLEFAYQEELWGIKEKLVVNWQDEYEHEVSLFKKMLDDELISQSQFEKKLFDLRVLNSKKWFDYYNGLSLSMFSAIQQAEIDESDAKYDVLIRQAENAGEDTAVLEEEKENKKLEIQKRYADVDFAIKASQIVADTAVAIMKTWSQLGWPAGAIGAAFIAATGAAQLISAKAERDRIKNLQPRKTANLDNAMPTAERVLSGYSEGGYTGDGRKLEVAGIVHKGEYVVPQNIMRNPLVVDAVGTIEAIRRHKGSFIPSINNQSSNSSFAYGGFTGIDFHELQAVANELRKATEAVRNIRSYIVYQDIEKAGQVLTQARAPFTRKS